MPTALIADDEPFMRAALRDQLAALWPELQIVSEAEDGPGALRAIEALQPDIAFLDIQMPGLTGLQVAQSISTRSCVVFVTAHEAHAVEAFDHQAVDYVLKPVRAERLAEAGTGGRAAAAEQTATVLRASLDRAEQDLRN